jgi:hypothetical protein
MKFFKGYLCILFLVVNSPSFAYTVKGAGNESCSTLLREDSGANSDSNRFIYAHWITGYVTALNRVNNAQKGKGIDPFAFYYEVKNYCERNPQNIVEDATYWVYVNKLK